MKVDARLFYQNCHSTHDYFSFSIAISVVSEFATKRLLVPLQEGPRPVATQEPTAI
jgi:hypothetical protein